MKYRTIVRPEAENDLKEAFSWDYVSIDGKSVLVIGFEKNIDYLKDILYMN